MNRSKPRGAHHAPRSRRPRRLYPGVVGLLAAELLVALCVSLAGDAPAPRPAPTATPTTTPTATPTTTPDAQEANR